MLRTCPSALVLERRLRDLVDYYSASYALNLFKCDIRDSNIYISFSNVGHKWVEPSSEWNLFAKT